MSTRISYEQYKNRSRGIALAEPTEQINGNVNGRIELRERLMDNSTRDIVPENYDETRAELRSIGHNLVR